MAKKVLTVDDSRTMREMVTYTLKSAGFEVLEAEDGKNAIEVLGDQKVDLVIADLNMPNMDGFTLIETLRANPTYQFTPILVLTTEGGNDKKSAAKQSARQVGS